MTSCLLPCMKKKNSCRKGRVCSRKKTLMRRDAKTKIEELLESPENVAICLKTEQFAQLYQLI